MESKKHEAKLKLEALEKRIRAHGALTMARGYDEDLAAIVWLEDYIGALHSERDSLAELVARSQSEREVSLRIANRERMARREVEDTYQPRIDRLEACLQAAREEHQSERDIWDARQAEFEESASEWQRKALEAERKLKLLGVTPDWECAHGAKLTEPCEDCNPEQVHPPKMACQMCTFYSSDVEHVHLVTRKSKQGMSQVPDESCCGPLNTEEERALGMCASCIAKFGKRLGEANSQRV